MLILDYNVWFFTLKIALKLKQYSATGIFIGTCRLKIITQFANTFRLFSSFRQFASFSNRPVPLTKFKLLWSYKKSFLTRNICSNICRLQFSYIYACVQHKETLNSVQHDETLIYVQHYETLIYVQHDEMSNSTLIRDIF